MVCDNAKVHNAWGIQEILVRMVEDWGIELKFLPTYSPEFNPCELVFAMVKKNLRQTLGSSEFLEEIFFAFAKVSRDVLERFYTHCLEFLFVHGLHLPPY